MEPSTYLKVFFPALIAWCIGIAITPIITKYLYQFRMWKKTAREMDNPDEMSADYEKIHNMASERRTPRVGGVIIWISVLLTALFFWLLEYIAPTESTSKIEFVSRSQTWIMFAVMLLGGVVGLIDDMMQIFPKFFGGAHGFSRKQFASIMALIGLVGGWWFTTRLGITSIIVPFYGVLDIGWAMIPLFVITILGLFSSGVIDGIDGLSGGVLSIIYGAFGVIALMTHHVDIATFCFVTAASIFAFLWFNVPPARFYMGETGMLALTLPLGFMAFFTGHVIWILIIGLPLVATSLSSFLQINGKKYFGVKVFRVAPLHHHFQALGWPNERVVMRYWIFTMVVSIFGIVLAIVSV